LIEATIEPIRWERGDHRQALVELLDHYARQPSGGGRPLEADVRRRLPDAFAALPGAFALLASCQERPVGLATCLTSFSTFRAAPRINIHDLVVHAEYRGRGIGRQLIAAVRDEAVRRHACAVTLEVRCDNSAARRLYAREGFEGVADPLERDAHLFGVLPLADATNR
jgi:ribosomal protein S18 acetylase RimI-like enzyme